VAAVAAVAGAVVGVESVAAMCGSSLCSGLPERAALAVPCVACLPAGRLAAALMWAGVAAASRVRAAAVCLWGRRHRVRSPVLASWAG
jgi:hypothetical protein